MVKLIVGVPGSGKTYLSVLEMIETKKKIWTNIPLAEDLKTKNKKLFEKIEFSFENFDEQVMPIICSLYDFRNERKKLIETAKNLNFFGKHIFFDECHMSMDTQKRELIWLLTFHRHLELDITLITQNKQAIVSKYRAIPELFTMIVPPTKRVSKHIMKSIDYAGFAMSKDKIGSHSYKVDKKIFTYYQTGENNEGSGDARKKMYLILGLLIFTILSMILFVKSFSSKKDSQAKIEKKIEIDNNNTARERQYSDIDILQTIHQQILEDYPIMIHLVDGQIYFQDGTYIRLNRKKMKNFKELLLEKHKTRVLSVDSFTNVQFRFKRKSAYKIVSLFGSKNWN